MAYDVNLIANKLIVLAQQQNDPLTNMKLQKLLYYQQGFHIAIFGEPLFNENIEAWMYGPVVPSVYERFSEWKYNVIIISPSEDRLVMDNKKENALFLEVYHQYSNFSASKLMEMTHSESPWKSTNIGKGNVISTDKLASFFKTRIKK